jgi:hypothetical protein
VPVPVQVLVPQKNAGFLKPASVFRSSSYYKGGENQKNRRPGCGLYHISP